MLSNAQPWWQKMHYRKGSFVKFLQCKRFSNIFLLVLTLQHLVSTKWTNTCKIFWSISGRIFNVPLTSFWTKGFVGLNKSERVVKNVVSTHVCIQLIVKQVKCRYDFRLICTRFYIIFSCCILQKISSPSYYIRYAVETGVNRSQQRNKHQQNNSLKY